MEFPSRSCDNSSRNGEPSHGGGHQRSRLFAKDQHSHHWKVLQEPNNTVQTSKEFTGLLLRYLYGSWLEPPEEAATSNGRISCSWEVAELSWDCSAGSCALLSYQQLGRMYLLRYIPCSSEPPSAGHLMIISSPYLNLWSVWEFRLKDFVLPQLRGDLQWLYSSRAVISDHTINLIFLQSQEEATCSTCFTPAPDQTRGMEQLLTSRGELGLVCTLGDGHTSKPVCL